MNTGSHIIRGSSGKSISVDYLYTTNNTPKSIILFAHGFKGFKDWGHWHLIGQHFAQAGHIFVKFNFSHNGTTVDQPTDFADLEAFGQNNYSKELFDIQQVIAWLSTTNELPGTQDGVENITLIGHSRGGPIVAIEAVQNPNIKQVITWASVHQLDYAWQSEQQLAKWKEKGVFYILNGRTYQEMPLYYQIYEDFEANKDLFDVKNTLRQLDKPLLILHGSADPAVPSFSAELLKDWSTTAELSIIDGANHVFGGKHPFAEEELPEHSKILVERSLSFIESN